MYIALDLKHHPLHQPINSDGIYKHNRNLDNLTRANATRLGLPVSILFERAVFEDSYRGNSNPTAMSCVALVGMQLLVGNSDCLNGVSS